MMKNKTISNILTVACIVMFVVSFTGCKDDLSSLDTVKLPDITVDTSGSSMLSVFQFDQLQLDPEIIETDANGHNFVYEWLINIEPRSIEYITIGTTKRLEYEVSFAPTNSGYYHQVLLKITDADTGIEYFQEWPLTIRNSIGEGLVIAETDDGINTDLSHLMSPLVTPDFEEERVRYKIYSGVNGKLISGLVDHMVYTQIGSNKVMLSSTPNTIFSIKTLDYKLDLENEELYYAPQSSYGTSYIGGIVQNDVIVYEGQLYANWLQIAKIGLPFSNSYHIPSILALNARYDYPNIVLNYYSEEKGHFVFQPSFSSYGDRAMRPVPAFDGVFNPNNLPNKENIAAAVNIQGDFMHLLKDKQTNNHGLYILDAGGYDGENYVVIPSKPKQYVDLSSAPEIDQAKHFVFLDNQRVLLYATDTKIYAAIYSSSTPSFGLRYTADAGEKITTLSAYYQADYPKVNRTYFSRNGKQLILSTYNGTEGKVHILPLINEGLANIDQANIKTYAGFGKILFTATQL